MGRLIDADALIAELNEKGIPFNAQINGIIMSQLTAYDVDKVVEQIRDMQAEMEQFGLGDMPSDIIEIVKGGGANA